MKIAVLGGGGWGTALAIFAGRKRPPGHPVVLSGAGVQAAPGHGREPPCCLGCGCRRACPTPGTWTAWWGGDVVVMATPSFGVRSTAEQIAGRLSPGPFWSRCQRGLKRGTFLRMSQIIREATGDRFPVVTLSGPSHAEEVARKVPTAVVSASPDRARRNRCRTSSSTTTSASAAARRGGGRAGGCPEKRHGPVHRLLHRHGVWGQYQGHAHDPGPGGDGPPGGGPGGPAGDLRRPGRDGGTLSSPAPP